MCQPVRSCLACFLGNGCAGIIQQALDETQSLPHYLSDLGYRVGIAGKVHVLPTAFPFESVAGFDLLCTPTYQGSRLIGVREFMSRDAGQPFCLVVALVEPHVPWVMGDASMYPTDQLQLPPTLADTADSGCFFSLPC